jgi:hypothetical protein
MQSLVEGVEATHHQGVVVVSLVGVTVVVQNIRRFEQSGIHLTESLQDANAIGESFEDIRFFKRRDLLQVEVGRGSEAIDGGDELQEDAGLLQLSESSPWHSNGHLIKL